MVGRIGGISALPGAEPTAAMRLAGTLGGAEAVAVGRYDRDRVSLLFQPLAADLAADQPFTEARGAVLVGDGTLDPAPLQLYRAFGTGFAQHLEGGNALALYDPELGRLLLTRDGFGIKPLYYAETPHGIAFASTPLALIAAGLVAPVLRPAARNALLQRQVTPGRATVFAGIDRVLPGETMLIENGRIIDRIRRPPFSAAGPVPTLVEPALAMLGSLLTRAVARPCQADGPIGLFLSGGIASSVLLSLMAEQGPAPVEALTLVFSQPAAMDEIDQARRAAAAVGAHLGEIPFREADFWHLLPEAAAAIDDPMIDPALIPFWKLSAAAAEAGFRTMLAGGGDDAVFGGAARYHRLLRPWWRGGWEVPSAGMLDLRGLLRQKLSGGQAGQRSPDDLPEVGGRTRVQQAQAEDCADGLAHGLLNRFDRCLAAHGLDGRLPFLDRALADFAFTLPDALKIHAGLGKWLLRRWLDERLPMAAAMKPRPRGRMPMGEWLRRRGDMLGPLVARQPGVAEICHPAAVIRLFRQIGDERAAFAAWTLLFYALWHRAHIQRLAPEQDTFQTLSSHV